jgi:ribosomal protein S18 acetylase RimI-like enzyme
MVVVESPEPLLWTAKRDGRAAGRLRAFVRPDRRCFLSSGDCDRDAYGLLIDAALQAVQCDLYIEVDEADTDAYGDLRARGFAVNRIEDHYVLPADPATTGLSGCAMPAGFAILSAAQANPDRWRELDDALRQDVPGTAGWRNDPETFGEQTFDDPEFDPATYLLAVEQAGGRYVGLVRVWITASGPRLGLIGTLSSHRRRGLARALIAGAFSVLHHRGQTSVTCEVDQSNNASQHLMTSMGARHDGTTAIELVWRHAEP